jgi:hypothetical protein
MLAFTLCGAGCDRAVEDPAWVVDLAKKCIKETVREPDYSRLFAGNLWLVNRDGRGWTVSMKATNGPQEAWAAIDAKTRRVIDCRASYGVF